MSEWIAFSERAPDDGEWFEAASHDGAEDRPFMIAEGYFERDNLLEYLRTRCNCTHWRPYEPAPGLPTKPSKRTKKLPEEQFTEEGLERLKQAVRDFSLAALDAELGVSFGDQTEHEEHAIFEAAVEMLYGTKYFEWLNPVILEVES